MRVAIVGSRDWSNVRLVNRTVQFLRHINRFTMIVSGAGGNVDNGAENEAKRLKMAYCIFPAQWDDDGKKAGIIRNPFIAAECTFGLVFWDEISTGTANTVSHLERLERPYLITKPTDELLPAWEKIKQFIREKYANT